MAIRDDSNVRRLAAVMVAALMAAGAASHPSSDRLELLDPLRSLVRAASSVNREITPRLTGGFAWAPLRRLPGNQKRLKRESSELQIAAAEIIQLQSGDASLTARHAVAVSELLVGNPHNAVQGLSALAGQQPSGELWNDLAAAQFACAARDDDPASLGRALAAVDAALEASPSLPEARFNRALILETLGLRDQARDDWRMYLRLDNSSGWGIEARQHIVALQPEEPFAHRFGTRYSHLIENLDEARALTRAYPQESRVAAEENILAQWGEATLRGDDAEASRHLGLARAIGLELVRNGGDGMVAALTASIDRADASQQIVLAHAHVHFREGRELYRKRELKTAERTLTAAAAEFAHVNSPGTLLARAFTANTIFEDLRVSEAGQRLEPILAEAASRFPALRAGMLWELGGVASAAGRWGTALQDYAQSVAIFEQIGNRNYAAIVRGLLASAYARLGEPHQAWKHRMLALEGLGRTPSFRLHQAIDAVTQSALSDGDWPLASSFLGLDIDLAQRTGDAQVTIEARLSRGEVRARLHHAAAAEDDLREARRMIEDLHNVADRRHYGANAKAVEALLTGSPTVAATLLTEAIAFHETVGRRMHLPWLMMLRGRAYRAMGDDVRAQTDFDAGIRELEDHRASLRDGEDRWGVFHAADDLFAAAITLALDEGSPQRAFAYAERERARGLLDALGASWRPVAPSDVPVGTSVVEYAAYDAMLVIFTLDAHGVRAVRQNVARETVRREIARFNTAIASSNLARIAESGGVLYQRLLRPVQASLDNSRRIALVPDPRLDSLPFAAMPYAGGFLVEHRVLTIEPSAAVFTRLHQLSRVPERQVLIVAGSDKAERLSFAEGEARAVASEFAHVRRLSIDNATTAAFAREATSADVIDFIGHSVASNGSPQSGYLLLGGRNASGERLDVKQIAALRLPHTSLVVLAACATAAGEGRATEGTLSVARAFLAAGVPSVVATLRPIPDDEAAVFFPRFHRYVASGLAPADALRRTQMESIVRGGSATAMWTAVQVIGE